MLDLARETGETVKVAIIGTGRMGRGFATALAPKHQVTVGSRDPKRAHQTASKTGAARGTTYAEAAADAEVVILTVPWAAMEDAGHSHAVALSSPPEVLSVTAGD